MHIHCKPPPPKRTVCLDKDAVLEAGLKDTLVHPFCLGPLGPFLSEPSLAVLSQRGIPPPSDDPMSTPGSESACPLHPPMVLPHFLRLATPQSLQLSQPLTCQLKAALRGCSSKRRGFLMRAKEREPLSPGEGTARWNFKALQQTKPRDMAHVPLCFRRDRD